MGKHRSGTTFLSNLLLEHSQIAGVVVEKETGNITGGIFESGYFLWIEGRYGDISRFENYMELAAVLSRMEYFRLAGLTVEDLIGFYPASGPEVFRKAMKVVAQRKAADYWIEKTPGHTLKAKTLKQVYPDAKFIGIIRDEFDVGVSSLYHRQKHSHGRLSRLISLSITACWKALYDRSMKTLKKQYPEDVLLIHYPSLRDHKEREIRNICDFLGLRRESLETPYGKNTSFRGEVVKAVFPFEEKVTRLIYRVCTRYIPLALLRAVYEYPNRQSRKILPIWFFRSFAMSLEESQKDYMKKRTNPL